MSRRGQVTVGMFHIAPDVPFLDSQSEIVANCGQIIQIGSQDPKLLTKHSPDLSGLCGLRQIHREMDPRLCQHQ